MKRIHNIYWEEFKIGVADKSIIPKADLNKAYKLLKSPDGLKEWKIAITIFTYLSFIGFLGALVLFFVIVWWIPAIIMLASLLMMNAIRGASAKAVIDHSLKNPVFYSHALNSETLQLYNQ